MSNESREQKLTKLADLLTDFFIQKARDGDLTANEQKQVLQMLKDNGITIEQGQADPLAALADQDISMFDEEDSQGYYAQ